MEVATITQEAMIISRRMMATIQEVMKVEMVALAVKAIMVAGATRAGTTTSLRAREIGRTTDGMAT